MAAAEQPLKKRKLYDSFLDPSIGLSQAFTSPPPPPPPPSQEDIIKKRRNNEEIRNVYECYRRIRFCISQKDARLMPDFEQSYLSVITASRGCTSVQRIAAELIPRYAPYCPTALEAAAKVAVNMYNWSLALIMRGEDVDGVAYQIAKACIFGLVDICCTASFEAPTSTVIQGICSAVFVNVLTFFTSTFEGNDIYQIANGYIAKLQSMELFSEVKQEESDKDKPALLKLLEYRALCMFRIFFACPKNVLAACFELFASCGTDVGGHKRANYFLGQVTSQLNTDEVTHARCQTSDGEMLFTDSTGTSTDCKAKLEEANDKEKTSDRCTRCLMKVVIKNDPSLRHWIVLRYNKLCETLRSEVISELSSFLEKVFGSLSELVKESNHNEGSNEDSNESKSMNRHSSLLKISDQHDNAADLSGRDHSLRTPNISSNDTYLAHNNEVEKVSGQSVKPCVRVLPHESGSPSVNEREGSISIKDVEISELEDRSSFSKIAVSHQSVTKKPMDLKRNGSERGSNTKFGKEESANNDANLQSPKEHVAGDFHVRPSSPIVWYSDGDPAAMDVFSASKQLWLGSLGPDASETSIRLQFEDFGSLRKCFVFFANDFALIEYRNIIDAIRARNYMQASSPWGSCLRVKFLDVGLGARGAIKGAAVGESCHVHIGNVSCNHVKDEILHHLATVGLRAPRMVTNLSGENAVLLEYETAEEAALAMAHVRQYRRETGYQEFLKMNITPNMCTKDTFARTDNSEAAVSNLLVSPTARTLQNSIDSYKGTLSDLSSLFTSLCAKYNISRTQLCHPTTMWNEDRVATDTLWIGLPEFSSLFFTEDELMAICNVAVANAGSVIRLTRASMHNSGWLVHFSSVSAAVTALKNLRGCPGMFLQIEFRNSGAAFFHQDYQITQPNATGNFPAHDNFGSIGLESNQGTFYASPVTNIESNINQRASPRLKLERPGNRLQNGPAFTWTATSGAKVLDHGLRKSDDGRSKAAEDFPFAGHAAHANEQLWQYKLPEVEPQISTHGSLRCPVPITHGSTMIPPPVHDSTFLRPVYGTTNSSWDSHSLNVTVPFTQISTGMVSNSNLHVSACAAIPFIPSSVTPLAQLPGGSMQRFDPMVAVSSVPPLSSTPPPPDVPPPVPPSPPPLPLSQPPFVPPPPDSPPPLPSTNVETSNIQISERFSHYWWQGTLSKSGVIYCTVYASKETSDACKYSNGISEPADWPARLDVTKRTDFQHVKTTFGSTPPHKREVCRLLPSTTNDHKGFHDFISYLKQRECAGVIKVPAGKLIWARVLFILPYSPDICSLLAIAPHPTDCLIALVLSKDTNFEWI